MEFPSMPQPERKGLNELTPGDLIQLHQPPFIAKIVEDDDFGDLNAGKLTKQAFINFFKAMPQEDQEKIRRINPSLDL